MTDISVFQTELNDYYGRLAVASDEETELLLTHLFQFVLQNYEDGAIDLAAFVHSIAVTMQFPLANTGAFEEITEIAAELELPPTHIPGNPQEMTEKLVALIKAL
ncbi:MAG: hypothetical protein ACEQSA_05810 [Weeksellaceae bacterium]